MTMNILTTIFLLTLSAMPILCAAESQKLSLIHQVSKLINELAATEGFSDDDAIKVAVFFLEQLAGPKPPDQKLSTRIIVSKPESVTVYAGYDNGIGFTGFHFQFNRGDPAKGLRHAGFVSIKHIPSE